MQKIESINESNINNMAKDPAHVVIPPTGISSLTDYEDHLNEFHMSSLYLVTRDDDYFCNIRANHFCVEVGYNEISNEKQILITANHKGMRYLTMLKM